MFSTTFSIAKADKNIVIWDIRNNFSKEEFDKIEKILKNNRFYQIYFIFDDITIGYDFDVFGITHSRISNIFDVYKRLDY